MADVYAVKAHGKYLGLRPMGGILGDILYPTMVTGWVDYITEATLFPWRYEAEEAAAKQHPCARVVGVILREAT